MENGSDAIGRSWSWRGKIDERVVLDTKLHLHDPVSGRVQLDIEFWELKNKHLAQ